MPYLLRVNYLNQKINMLTLVKSVYTNISLNNSYTYMSDDNENQTRRSYGELGLLSKTSSSHPQTYDLF